MRLLDWLFLPQITIEHVLWIYIAVLFLLIAIIAKIFFSLSLVRLPRLLAVVCLLLLLARPAEYLLRDQESFPIYVDVSKSMSFSAVQKKLRELTKTLDRQGQAYSIIPFSSGGGDEAVSFGDFSSLRSSHGERVTTNIEEALQQGLTRGTSTVLLVTDGIETSGNIKKIVDEYRQQGVAIYPFYDPSFRETTEGAEIEDIHLPLYIAQGETIRGHVSLVSHEDEPVTGELYVYQEGKLIVRERLTIPARKNIIHELSLEPTGEDQEKLEFRFVRNGSEEESNATWFVHAESGDRVLLLSAKSQDGKYVKDALERSKVLVRSVISGPSALDISEDLGDYKTIVINNTPHKKLPRHLIDRAESYVKKGGRLVMIGGDASFGLGGYVGTDIDSLMPLRSIDPRKKLKKVNVAVQLVMDKSKSMQFGQKIEYAKQAAREVVRNLSNSDYIGVIGFDTTPFVAFPIRRLQEYRSMAIERIGTIFPTGRTNLFPALDEARRGLINVPAGRKHVIVLTDGKIPDEGPHYIQLVQQMRVRGITISTVMMGNDAGKDFLRTIAQYGGGSFYQTSDPRALPRIFLSDVRVTTKEQTMKEQKDFNVRRSKNVNSFMSQVKTYPPLRGFVQTDERSSATVELITTGGERAAPLLARRKVGKGTTIAYASDANGRWSSNWVGWRNFERFWRDVLTGEISASSDDRVVSDLSYDLRWKLQGDQLLLDLVVYDELGALNAELVVEHGKEKKRKILDTTEVAPGRFQASFSDPYPGIIYVSGEVDEQPFGPVALSLSPELFEDGRDLPVQVNTLATLAAATEGKVNEVPDPDAAQSLYSDRKKPFGVTTLLWLAFIFLLLDLIARLPWKSVFRRRVKI